MNQYQLVFNGTISDGNDLAEVKRNLASLFKIDAAKVDQLFEQLPFVVKKNVDYDAAMKYQQALRKAGAVCQVEETMRNIEPPVMEKAAPPPLTHTPDLSATDVDYIPDSQPVESEDVPKEGIKGLGDIISGVVLIGIGFALGGSIFMGNPSWLDYFFDGLGIFWIGRGIYKMVGGLR
ncbi:MAG: hypothetical protein P8X85_14895 [Desulfobacterales bacterium]|jgi:hypothetical protein